MNNIMHYIWLIGCSDVKFHQIAGDATIYYSILLLNFY